MADFANFCHQPQMFEFICLLFIYLMHAYGIFSKYHFFVFSSGKKEMSNWFEMISGRVNDEKKIPHFPFKQS